MAEPVEIEHSPAPQESRGIYGFVLFLFFLLFIVFYLLWIFIPSAWTKTWAYAPPQKYWAVALPVFFCTTLFLFAFCIYPALHSIQDGAMNDLSAITDRFAIKPVPVPNVPIKTAKRLSLKRRISERMRIITEDTERPIPVAGDMCLDEVCQTLYLKKFKNE